MAYNSANLFRLFDGASGLNEWQYLTTDSFTAVQASGYINDGYIQGLRPGDTFYVVIFTTANPDGTFSGFSSLNFGVVSTVAAYGAATIIAGDPKLIGLGAGVTHDANYTLVATDAGSALYHASASAHSWTIPSATLPVGSVVTFTTGQSSGTLSILAGGGVTLERVDGTAGTGTRTMAAASKVTAYQRAQDVWELSGVFAS